MYKSFTKEITSSELNQELFPLPIVKELIQAQLRDEAKEWLSDSVSESLEADVNFDRMEGKLDLYVIDQKGFKKIQKILEKLKEAVSDATLKDECYEVVKILRQDWQLD